MKLLRSWCVVLSAVAVAGMIAAGCGGVTDKKVADAETRIEALRAAGAPEAMISDANLILIQLKAARTAQSSSDYKKMIGFLEKAEAEWGNQSAQIRPLLDSLTASIRQRKAGLTGYQLSDADSLLAICDSLIKANQLLDAQKKCYALDAAMDQLFKDEETVKTLRPKVPGTWRRVADAEGEGVKAVEKKLLKLSKDGKLDFEEELKGTTSETRKEDWKFHSWGEWALKGDTVLIFIKREKCLKQVFYNLEEKDGKLEWVKWDGPTFDTTITNGMKDRYMTWEYLTKNFNRR
jgi:hypothetical protein